MCTTVSNALWCSLILVPEEEEEEEEEDSPQQGLYLHGQAGRRMPLGNRKERDFFCDELCSLCHSRTHATDDGKPDPLAIPCRVHYHALLKHINCGGALSPSQSFWLDEACQSDSSVDPALPVSGTPSAQAPSDVAIAVSSADDAADATSADVKVLSSTSSWKDSPRRSGLHLLMANPDSDGGIGITSCGHLLHQV